MRVISVPRDVARPPPPERSLWRDYAKWQVAEFQEFRNVIDTLNFVAGRIGVWPGRTLQESARARRDPLRSSQGTMASLVSPFWPANQIKHRSTAVRFAPPHGTPMDRLHWGRGFWPEREIRLGA